MPKGKPGSWKHGTRSGYNAGCACLACVAAERRCQRAYRRKQREAARSRGQSPQPARDWRDVQMETINKRRETQ